MKLPINAKLCTFCLYKFLSICHKLWRFIHRADKMTMGLTTSQTKCKTQFFNLNLPPSIILQGMCSLVCELDQKYCLEAKGQRRFHTWKARGPQEGATSVAEQTPQIGWIKAHMRLWCVSKQKLTVAPQEYSIKLSLLQETWSESLLPGSKQTWPVAWCCSCII